MMTLEVWKSDQNIFGDSVKDRRYISNILYRNFVRNKCFTNSRLREIGNIDWESIFYGLKKSLRLTIEANSEDIPKNENDGTDLVSLTYSETDEENKDLKEETVIMDDETNILSNQNAALSQTKCISLIPVGHFSMTSGSPKSNGAKKRLRNKTNKAKLQFDSYKNVSMESNGTSNDITCLHEAPFKNNLIPMERNENSRPDFSSKNEKQINSWKSVQPTLSANFDPGTNQNVCPLSCRVLGYTDKKKIEKDISRNTESINNIRKNYVLPKAVYRKHLHPKCFTPDEAVWKSNFRSTGAFVGAVNHVFRATEDDFDVVEIEDEEFFQSIRLLRYYQCEFNGKIWEVRYAIFHSVLHQRRLIGSDECLDFGKQKV